MKKLWLIMALALVTMGVSFADTTATTTAATITQASGTLSIVNGRIAIKDAGKTLYLEGIQHLVGFVDGLKEGAAVKVEGYAQSSTVAPEYVFLQLTKVTFNGKTYDIAAKGEHGEKNTLKHGRK